MMSLQDTKFERKVRKHNKNITGYNFQLPAYAQLIRHVRTIPILDSNMITLLEAVMDLLGKIADFSGFREPNDDEVDLNGHHICLTLGCRFCSESGRTALHLLGHIMNAEHYFNKHCKTRMKKFYRLKRHATEGYCTFLLKEQNILKKNHFLQPALEKLLDFYFITKPFLRMTSRYLQSLQQLDQQPSTIIARGVIALLEQIESLVSQARCLESIPDYNSLLMTYAIVDVQYMCEGKVFDQLVTAIDCATSRFGLKKTLVLPDRNIFSLPPSQMSHLPPVNHFIGSQVVVKSTAVTASGHPVLPNYPFTALPPVRMLPPTSSPGHALYPVGPLVMSHVHGTQPMCTSAPVMNAGSIAHPQLAAHQFLFNTAQRPPSIQPLPQQHQQHPAVFSHQTIPNNLPAATVFNHQQLPPLNQAGTADKPVLTTDAKLFLDKPNLESLIEIGSLLTQFETSSVIPSELVCALKAAAPRVKVSCFGAKVSGVGYEEDCINLYVDDEESAKTEETVKVLFTTLLDFFRDNEDDWVIQNKEEAGVRTHLTVKNVCENMCCRVSFSSEIYSANTNLIQYFVRTFPVCQQMSYFVQEFIKLVDLDFSRYLIIILVIFYLQMQDCMPTVAQLQVKQDDEQLSGDWLIRFTPKTTAELKLKACESDVRKCAAGFFQFYGNKFSFHESVVCPHAGFTVSRTDFSAANEWRLPLKSYKAYLEVRQAAGDAAFTRFDATTPMCVQDLLELTTNVAAQVTAQDTGKFVRVCQMAHEFYTNNQ